MDKFYHLQNHLIDRESWDSALDKSTNPLIYATSWYLDIVSPGWEAIISEDHQTIFPVTVKTSLGVKILIQPPFAQQLGIFSAGMVNPGMATKIIKMIPYPVASLNFHSGLIPPDSLKFLPQPNYTLPLDHSLTSTRARYNDNCRRNLKQAIKQGLSFEVSGDAGFFVNFINTHLKYKISANDLEKLRMLSLETHRRNSGFICSVYDKKGEVLSMALFLEKSGRVTFLQGASTPDGMKQKSMFLLIDEVISKYHSPREIIDFEGSANPGIARFYQGFGASRECYHVYRNPLLKFMKCIKKIMHLPHPGKKTGS